jgi:hypothetical protein
MEYMTIVFDAIGKIVYCVHSAVDVRVLAEVYKQDLETEKRFEELLNKREVTRNKDVPDYGWTGNLGDYTDSYQFSLVLKCRLCGNLVISNDRPYVNSESFRSHHENVLAHMACYHGQPYETKTPLLECGDVATVSFYLVPQEPFEDGFPEVAVPKWLGLPLMPWSLQLELEGSI